MYQILCPHCRAKLIDDGSLSGQATLCPMCGGKFRMPAIAQPCADMNPPPPPPPIQPDGLGSQAHQSFSITGVIPGKHVVMGILFVHGPGFWRATSLYWILLVVGLILAITVVFSFIGFAILAYLFVAALMSRSDWRARETQRAIRESVT